MHVVGKKLGRPGKMSLAGKHAGPRGTDKERCGFDGARDRKLKVARLMVKVVEWDCSRRFRETAEAETTSEEESRKKQQKAKCFTG